MSQTFRDHFSAVAEKYADCRPHYPAALFDFLATLAPCEGTVGLRCWKRSSDG